MGSALDVRTSSLLDPAKILLHGENMRRRGSDISRARPVITADVSEEVELATLSHRRSVDVVGGEASQMAQTNEHKDSVIRVKHEIEIRHNR